MVLKGILVVFILVTGTLFVITKIAFDKTFLKKKKNTEEAIRSLIDKEMFDRDIYNSVKLEEVIIKASDGIKLKGFMIENDKMINRFVIMVHGYSGNHHYQMPFVNMFLNEGFNILLVDQRNHGKSGGKYPTYGIKEKQDISDFIDYLNKRYGENLFLGLHGQSMGGATSLMCGAMDTRVDFVVSDCAFSSAKEVINSELGKHKYIPKTIIYSILKAVTKLKVKVDIEKSSPINDICACRKKLPILFVHGKADSKVPCSMGEDMYKRRNNKIDRLLLVDNAEHMVCYKHNKEDYEKNVHQIIETALEIKTEEGNRRLINSANVGWNVKFKIKNVKFRL